MASQQIVVGYKSLQFFGILLLKTPRGGQSGISFIFENKKLIHVEKILKTVTHDNPNL